MKKRLCAGCLLLLIGLASIDVTLACGDKFLISSRGTRYQKAPIKREPHAILIWANPASELPKALTDVPVDETLRKVGYQPTTVATATEFDSALNRGDWDLLIVGIGDAQPVSRRLQSNSPVVLPVVLNPSQMKQAKVQYEVVLKGPVKKASFLNAVDEALAHRSKKIARKGD